MDWRQFAINCALGGLLGLGIALAWGIGSLLCLKLFLRQINHERRKLAGADLADIDRMSGERFEEYLEVLFDRLGYLAIPTERYDKGADLILVKEGVRTAVQAKCWTRDLVGVEAIRAVVAAQRPYRCTRGIVVTNGRFTRNARQMAKDNNIELWDRDDLANVINTLNHPENPLPIPPYIAWLIDAPCQPPVTLQAATPAMINHTCTTCGH